MKTQYNTNEYKQMTDPNIRIKKEYEDKLTYL